jgi:hypothetical protein
MVNLYCITYGQFLDNLNLGRKYILNSEMNSIFFKKTELENIKMISKEIKKEGYSIFKNKLDDPIIKELKSLSFKLKTKVGDDYTYFDLKNKKHNIYKFDSNDLVNNKWVQKLIMDPVLKNTAGEYLGAEPIFDFAAMWWSTDSKKKFSFKPQSKYCK